MRSFGQLIDEHAAERPDAAGVTCGEQTMTRREFAHSTSRRARWYLSQGVGEGDVVAFALPNSTELLESVAAAWKIGAVPLVLPPAMPRAERTPILALAKPALVIDQPVPESRPWATLDDSPLPPAISPYWRASTSGGSTGRPKLIYTNQRAVTDPDQRTLYLKRDGCVVVPGPLYHGAPFLFATFGLMRGKHVVLLPKFAPDATLAACADHRADYLLLVPTMMNRITKLPSEVRARYDLSDLRAVLHLGASCPPDLKRWWIDWLGGSRIHELYAGTEGQAMTWIRGDEWLSHPGSVGRPVGGAQMRAFSEDGRELPPGEVGEIFMRAAAGRGQAYTYVGAKARRHGDWESLGDLGSVDADGYVYILDRRTDMIVSGGSNVYPAEVESSLEAHPGVRAAVVIGLPDADLGRRVHALVEPVGAASPELTGELLAYLSRTLVRYKIPRSIEYSAQPLRDEAGKVRRNALVAARTNTPDAGPEAARKND